MILSKYKELKKEIDDLRMAQQHINNIFVKDLEDIHHCLEVIDEKLKDNPEPVKQETIDYVKEARKKSYDKYLTAITRGASALKQG